jgi:hypothetical protein
MHTKQVTWRLDGKTVELGCDWSGQGPTVLLLPALSSISTRHGHCGGPCRDALASVPGVQHSALPLGKLSVHEEFPDMVAEAIKSFIQVAVSRKNLSGSFVRL